MSRQNSLSILFGLVTGLLLVPSGAGAEESADPLQLFDTGTFYTTIFDCDQKLRKKDAIPIGFNRPRIHPPFDGSEKICCQTFYSNADFESTGNALKSFNRNGTITDMASGDVWDLPDIITRVKPGGTGSKIKCITQTADGTPLHELGGDTPGLFHVNFWSSASGNVSQGDFGQQQCFWSEKN